MRPTKILVVDDERLIRWSLRQKLEGSGHEVLEAEDGRAARAAMATGPDLVLLDVRLPDVDGLDLLVWILEEHPGTAVVMMTAHGSVAMAVDAMKRGAFHYVAKPFDEEEILLLVERAVEATRLRRQIAGLRAQAAHEDLDGVIGDSAAMRDVKALARKVAASPASTVLITGESGTGKGVLARAIHAASGRALAPLLNITCSALPEALLESELFGHEKGAFTDARTQKTGLLELADGGTVFLDEVGEMTAKLQAKLLRFLEDKAFRRVGGATEIVVDVRIIAATNRDLAAAMAAGEFRSDLYYRLAVMPIHLPPLRDRMADLDPLVDHFVAAYAREFGKAITGPSRAARESLARHTWPGNVRELRNAIERAVLLADGPEIVPADLRMPASVRPTSNGFELPAEGVDLALLERELVVQALGRARGNQTRAAALLGMNRDQIRYRMQKFELDPSQFGES